MTLTVPHWETATCIRSQFDSCQANAPRGLLQSSPSEQASRHSKWGHPDTLPEGQTGNSSAFGCLPIIALAPGKAQRRLGMRPGILPLVSVLPPLGWARRVRTPGSKVALDFAHVLVSATRPSRIPTINQEEGSLRHGATYYCNCQR